VLSTEYAKKSSIYAAASIRKGSTKIRGELNFTVKQRPDSVLPRHISSICPVFDDSF